MALAKQWALVTGAARGIGRAIAIDIAREHGNIVLVDRPTQTAREQAESVKVNLYF